MRTTKNRKSKTKSTKLKVKSFLKHHRHNIIIYAILTLVATAFVFLFSLSTSPIFSNYLSYAGVNDGADSPHFMTDGQNWLHGRIPYRDTFDHKGPIIFLVNMIGLGISNSSRYGLILLQIIFLTVTLIFVWKTSQLARKSYLWGGISVALTLLFMIPGYSAGNTVQEYNLPFIMVAIYYLVKYFYQKELGEHNPRWAFIYGIAIGSCLLLQVTHAIPICAGILAIIIILISQKRWRNLWQNLGMGLAGIAVMWVPFAIYFLLNGAFGDFIYCTITFNLNYATKIGSWLHGANGERICYFLTTFIPFFCVGGAAILAFVRNKKAYAGVLLITFVLEAYLFLSAENYPQYALVTFFQVSLLLNEILLFEHQDEVKKLAHIGMIAFMTILTYNQIIDRASILMDQYNAIRAAGVDGIGYEEIMEEHLPEIQQNSFTVFGHNPTKSLYVRYGLVSQNRVPLIQTWLARFSNTLNNDIQTDFLEHKATYLLTEETTARDEAYGISDILDQYYKKIDASANNTFVLYRLKESKDV